MASNKRVRIGTAGWTLPKAYAETLPPVPEGEKHSHLQRYAGVMNCVEINSTFYRPHQAKTFERWVATTPEDFRFAVKLAKAVTHTAKLTRCGAELAAFFDNVRPLGEKLGPVLVQLPPKLTFEEGTAREFFETVRELHAGPVVVEPRNVTWFAPPVGRLLKEFEIARAMADPPAGSPLAEEPGGWMGLRYYRLHGSPVKYRSAYETKFLETIADSVKGHTGEAWVIFDNTASNQAFGNAQQLSSLLGSEEGAARSRSTRAVKSA